MEVSDGFVLEEREGHLYRIVKQEWPSDGTAFSGEIRVGGQYANKGGVRIQAVSNAPSDVIYLEREQVMGLIVALAVTLGEVERGERIQP
jgi:hypothetical protein